MSAIRSNDVVQSSTVTTFDTAAFTKFWLVCHYQIELFNYFQIDIATCFSADNNHFKPAYFWQALGVAEMEDKIEAVRELYGLDAACLAKLVVATFPGRLEDVKAALTKALDAGLPVGSPEWAYGKWVRNWVNKNYKFIDASCNVKGMRVYSLNFSDSVRPIFVKAKAPHLAISKVCSAYSMTVPEAFKKLRVVSMFGPLVDGKCKGLPRGARIL